MTTKLVLVTGPPGAGRTTLARRLGPALRVPVIDEGSLVLEVDTTQPDRVDLDDVVSRIGRVDG